MNRAKSLVLWARIVRFKRFLYFTFYLLKFVINGEPLFDKLRMTPHDVILSLSKNLTSWELVYKCSHTSNRSRNRSPIRTGYQIVTTLINIIAIPEMIMARRGNSALPVKYWK